MNYLRIFILPSAVRASKVISTSYDGNWHIEHDGFASVTRSQTLPNRVIFLSTMITCDTLHQKHVNHHRLLNYLDLWTSYILMNNRHSDCHRLAYCCRPVDCDRLMTCHTLLNSHKRMDCQIRRLLQTLELFAALDLKVTR